jgi:hypothetical protein
LPLLSPSFAALLLRVMLLLLAGAALPALFLVLSLFAAFPLLALPPASLLLVAPCLPCLSVWSAALVLAFAFLFRACPPLAPFVALSLGCALWPDSVL